MTEHKVVLRESPSNRGKLCECVCIHCQRAGYHWPDECGYMSGVNKFRPAGDEIKR